MLSQSGRSINSTDHSSPLNPFSSSYVFISIATKCKVSPAIPTPIEKPSNDSSTRNNLTYLLTDQFSSLMKHPNRVLHPSSLATHLWCLIAPQTSCGFTSRTSQIECPRPVFHFRSHLASEPRQGSALHRRRRWKQPNEYRGRNKLLGPMQMGSGSWKCIPPNRCWWHSWGNVFRGLRSPVICQVANIDG